MEAAGLDKKFTPHSTRSASSKARSVLPIESILKAAGWANSTTFTRYMYYKKDIVRESAFGDAVLH